MTGGKKQGRGSVRECLNAQLKEIKEGKGDSAAWMTGTIKVFLKSETVVSANEDSKNCLKVFQLPGKTPAAPCQGGDIMAQISIDAFHSEGVILVVYVVNMFSWINDIQIAAVPVGTIIFRLRSHVDHPLDRSG